MGKMSWIHHLASNGSEEELVELLTSLKWSKGAARTGAKEFIKAANEIEKVEPMGGKIIFKDGKKQENE